MTGLTSNPTIFDNAIGDGGAYDDGDPRARRASGKSGEALFFELALEDLRRAADLFRPVHDAHRRRRRLGVAGSLAAAGARHRGHDRRGGAAASRAAPRPNLFIKIPGTPEGVPAIEESIFAGVPINVTLLFSREQYLAAAEAYLRGIERRIAAGLDPQRRLGRVAVRQPLGRGGEGQGAAPNCATGSASRSRSAPTRRIASCSRRRAGSKLAAAGARPQRLLWASTGTKDPDAPDTLYVEALAAPDTINTMPEKTLHAFADHGELERRDAGRRRRRRGGARASSAQAGVDDRRARRAAAARGRRGVRQVVERAAAAHRRQERAARQRELDAMQPTR